MGDVPGTLAGAVDQSGTAVTLADRKISTGALGNISFIEWSLSTDQARSQQSGCRNPQVVEGPTQGCMESSVVARTQD